MKRYQIILICVCLIIVVISAGIVLTKKNNNEKEPQNLKEPINSSTNQEEINKNIAVGYELPETNMTDFIDTYNTEERIEKYAEERTIEKVRMEIKEGTLTNVGATVVIYDDNEYHFAYSEEFSIEKKRKQPMGRGSIFYTGG